VDYIAEGRNKAETRGAQRFDGGERDLLQGPNLSMKRTGTCRLNLLYPIFTSDADSFLEAEVRDTEAYSLSLASGC